VAYLLALDQGTTSSRALLFDRRGAVHAVAQREFPQIFPRPGWVEHDPLEIWASQIGVAVEVLGRGGVTRQDLAAVGITNQRETTLVWDRRSGQPIANAIVWQDRRTAGFCEQLKADGAEPLVQERTGLVLDAYFSASKIRWLLDHVPGARALAGAGHLAFGTVDAWLLWNLTDGRCHETDVTNAARTLLFNIHTRDWDEDLLRLFDVPAGMLPAVRPSSHRFARISTTLGLGDVEVAGMAGDQQAALFGQRCATPGLAKTTYGTGCFLLQHTGAEPVASRHRLLTTIAWETPRGVEYAVEGSVFIGGAVVQWLRDGLGLIRTAADIEPLARQVPDSGGVVFVPAFSGLGAPHWDPYARGLLAGITRGTTAAHIGRAALEAIALQVADVIDAMRADTGLAVAEMRADGGASVNDLLLQIQADLLGAPVVRPAVTETTALGAAYLAGLAVGFWNDEREIDAQWQIARRFEPGLTASQVNSLKARWREALARAGRWQSADPD